MFFILKSFLIFTAFCLCVVSAKDYSKFKIYDVTPNKSQVRDFVKWQFKDGIEFITRFGADKASRVMVSPELQSSFIMHLNKNGLVYNLFIDDVGTLLMRNITKSTKSNKPNFELYWSYEEMETYSMRLAQQYPNMVKRDVIGKSIEGRDIFGLRISSGSEFGKKPIIFIDTGTHAREWVGPHTVLYFIDQLVTNSSVASELLDKVDWVFVPNVNPDGYVYSFTEDRFWRKNRRPVNYTCIGIDLNRNYGYVWEDVPNSCSGSNYPGRHALSEPETIAVSQYMKTFKSNLRMYLSVHSAGPQILWPYGFDFDVYVNNWKEHEHVGRLFADAVYKATGTLFEVGNSADILYTANGASDDYALAFANANLAYTIELPPSDYNWHDYPQDMIYDLAKGIFFGYRELGLYIGENYNYNF